MLFFKKYLDKDFMTSLMKSFAIKKIKLFIASCTNVQNAIEFLLELNSNSACCYDLMTLEPLYIFIARFYRDGVNGTFVNYDKAIDYYSKAKTQLAIFEKDEMVFNLCKKFIHGNEYEKAKRYVDLI